MWWFKELGVHERVGEKDAVKKSRVASTDAKRIDTEKAWCEGKHMLTRSREYRNGDSHWRQCGIMHQDVSRASFPRDAQRPVFVGCRIKEREM